MAKWVVLVWKGSDEAVCPECGRNNACLHTSHIGNTQIYECRDCHKIYAVDNSMAYREVNGQVTERDAIIIERTLGKTCSGCKSFNIRYTTREEMKTMKSPFFDRPAEHICNDCGKIWG